MKKRLLSLFMSVCMIAGTAAAVNADEAKTPKVYVNSSEVYFADQEPVIKNDFTLIPARGVFEAMNNKVRWDGEKQTVTISSSNNLIRVILTIGSDVMSVYHFTSIMEADQTDYTLEVAPQIINDRTMIPLRAISEALGAEVNWDKDEFAAYIKTAAKAEDAEAKKLAVSLAADKTEVKAGETVTLSINLANLDLYPDMYVSGVTAGVDYDADAFELTGAALYGADGKEVTGAMGAYNGEYLGSSSKIAYVTIDSDAALKADGTAAVMTFKAKKETESTFKLADRYNSKLGNDLTILLGNVSDSKTKMIEGENLIIDTTPVSVKVQGVAEDADKVTDDNTDAKADDTAAEDKIADTKADDTAAAEEDKADNTKADDTADDKADDTKADDTAAAEK